jgi:Uma2 family endonuclease
MKLTARQLRYIDPPRETEVPPFPVRKFKVAEYHKLLSVGIFVSGDPYELLRGWIVPKIKRSPRNSSATSRLHRRMPALFTDDDWLACPHGPITFSDSEPEPACSVVRGPDDLYNRRHPRPSETGFVVEVSDETIGRDRGIKLEIYASGGIPVYWIVNLIDRRVEVYTEPRGGKNPTYRKHTDYAPGEDVPVTVGRKRLGTIAASELLP